MMVAFQDALPLTEVESAFDTSVESIGDRDCKIQRISALKGYYFRILIHVWRQEPMSVRSGSWALDGGYPGFFSVQAGLLM